MANHKSALKRIRQTETKTERNRDRISRIRTFIKKFMAKLGTAEANTLFSQAQSEIARGVTKGVLHRNTADRKISNLNRLLKSSGAK